MLEGVDPSEVGGLAAEMGLPGDFIAVSAQRGWGLDALRERIVGGLADTMVELDVLIPYQRNDLVSLWHKRGMIEQEEYAGEGTHILGRIPRELARQFDQYRNGKH
jgi:GTPase